MPKVRVFHVVKPLPQFGSGSNPNPELFLRVGTVANTTYNECCKLMML